MSRDHGLNFISLRIKWSARQFRDWIGLELSHTDCNFSQLNHLNAAWVKVNSQIFQKNIVKILQMSV